MRWIKVVFLVLSIILLFLIVYAILNSMVSYKYEIEEPPKLHKIDTGLAVGYLNSQITWLWCFFSYVGINIIFLLSSMFSKRKNLRKSLLTLCLFVVSYENAKSQNADQGNGLVNLVSATSTSKVANVILSTNLQSKKEMELTSSHIYAD